MSGSYNVQGFGTLAPERRQEFLDDLTTLTRKHRVEISGCACCGSPNLWVIEPEVAAGLRYVWNEGFEKVSGRELDVARETDS